MENNLNQVKGIILKEPGKLADITLPFNGLLKDDEALVKVHRVGICGTDMHAYKGRQPFFTYPRILGHELGVEVIEVGETVGNVKVGDKCSVEPYFYNEQDQAPRRGKTNCAEQLSVLGVHEDGGMREYFKLPAKYLHASSKLSYDQLAIVETLGIGCHAVNRAQLTKDDFVLVIGVGPIGLGAAQFAKISGAEVAVMDLSANRLAFCQKELGIDATINLKEEEPLEKLKEIFSEDLPNVIFDATGNVNSMKATLDYAAHGSRIVFIGLFQGEFSFFDPLFHKKEITLMSSRNALASDFTQIIGLMEIGTIDIKPWINFRMKSTEMVEQFEDLFEPGSNVVKAMVEFS